MAKKSFNAGQLIPTSSTPPSNAGFYRIDKNTIGVVGNLVQKNAQTNVESNVASGANLAAELAAIGVTASAIDTILEPADIASRPPRLWPSDSVPIELYCSDGKYAYGHDNTQGQVRRVHVGTMAQSNGHDFGAGFSLVEMFSGHGILLAVVQTNANSKFTLHRSTDQGMTFSAVHNIGTSPDGLSHGDTIKILMRGLDFGEIGGRQAIVFGTYNVSSATAGTDGDTVYLAVSYDNGVTWQKLNTWNIGTRKVRHVHVVRYDKFRKNWIFSTGDAPTELCLFRWDGYSEWPGDVTPATLAGVSGFTVLHGKNRYRVVDVLVTQDWMYSFTDTISNADGGIWRFRPDFTEHHRVNHDVLGKHHEGWCSLQADDGTLLWMDDCRADTTNNNQRFIGIYASRDGNRWFDIGHIHLTGSGVKIPRGMFNGAGKIWISVDGLAGKGTYGTTAFTLSGKFREERPDNLGPCYYVDFDNGNDANDGWSKAGAWKTVRNIVASSGNITYGARVVLSNGTSTENGVATIDYSANAASATDTTRHVQISGQGKNSTTVVISGATEGWRDTSTTKTWQIEFANMALLSADATKSILWDQSTISVTPATWTIRDAIIGDLVTGSARAVYLRSCQFVGIRSEIRQIASTSKYTMYIDGTAVATVTSCLLDGGRALQGNGGKITAKHCEFTRFASIGLTMASGCTLPYVVQNCIFSDSEQNPLTNSSATPVTSAEVFGNNYVTTNGAGIPTPTLFSIGGAMDRNPATLAPYSWSTLVGRCANIGVAWDINGNPFRIAPAVGCAEIA